jgi:hypothetical protein
MTIYSWNEINIHTITNLYLYEPVANLISQKIQHQKIWFGSFRNFLFNFFAVFADFSRDLIRSFVGFCWVLVFFGGLGEVIPCSCGYWRS